MELASAIELTGLHLTTGQSGTRHGKLRRTKYGLEKIVKDEVENWLEKVIVTSSDV
jgi:hypothetical protein